jgi:hypothetical protein
VKKNKQAVKEEKPVRLHVSEHRDKNTKKRSTKRYTSTYIVAHKSYRDNSERESRIWTLKRLKVSKVARVDTKKKVRED